MKFKIESLKHQADAVDATMQAIGEGKRRIDIEMETGTGKTFTFISTIFKAYKTYGLNKFIIVAPRIAIKEGIYESFNIFRDFFKDKYPEISYDVYNYSGKLNNITSFLYKEYLQILILTPQSFNKAMNILNADRDDLYGQDSYIKQIAQVQPCLIIDETHITGGKEGKTKEAIQGLNPKITFGYSATHIDKSNIVYSFSATRAFEERQVKRLEYWNFELDNKAIINFTIEDFNDEKKTAKLKLNGKTKIIKIGSEVEGLKVKIITKTDVFFEGGKKYSELKAQNPEESLLLKNQIRGTIKEHLNKKKYLASKGIKVLSLFFVPTVSDFIGSEGEKGIVQTTFEEEYKNQTGEIANGKFAYYFSVKKGLTAEVREKEMTNLILKEKAQLLSLSNPVEFIFAHTSLGTGWDNPNIFQICFLRNIVSEVSRKQFVGRGLRLCVNQTGERIFEGKEIKDEDRMNNLIIIANENHKTFYEAYQKESGFISADGRPQINLQKQKTQILARPEKLDLLKTLHVKLKQKTRWFISFGNLEVFYAKVIDALSEIKVQESAITLTKTDFITKENLAYDTVNDEGYKPQDEYKENQIINEIAKETWLSILEVQNIFAKLNKEAVRKNPALWTQRAISLIKAKEEEYLFASSQVTYEKLEGEEFDLKDFYIEEGRETSVKPKPSNKSIYNYTDVDSDTEESVVDELESEQCVEFYIKFQKTGGFHIFTPKGEYTPDFGIIIKNSNGKFYLVLETKGKKMLNLTPEEKFKIRCAVAHFNAIGIESKFNENEFEFEGILNKSHKINKDSYSVYNPKSN